MAEKNVSKESLASAAKVRELMKGLTAKREILRKAMVSGDDQGEDAAVRSRSATNDLANLDRIAKRYESGVY